MGSDVLREVPNSSIPVDFVALAGRWCASHSVILLNFVWQGYDLLLAEFPAGINENNLERSITQSLVSRIRRMMSGDEPFDIEHGFYEQETMQSPPAQPPEYDLAFVLRYPYERIMWPLEAKVLKTDGAVGEYVKGMNDKFLSCYYAPFSREGAMLGYLLSGTTESVFRNLEAKVPCALAAHPDFPNRPCKMSDHTRHVEAGKPYPSQFRCYHLILEFSGFARRTRRRRV